MARRCPTELASAAKATSGEIRPAGLMSGDSPQEPALEENRDRARGTTNQESISRSQYAGTISKFAPAPLGIAREYGQAGAIFDRKDAGPRFTEGANERTHCRNRGVSYGDAAGHAFGGRNSQQTVALSRTRALPYVYFTYGSCFMMKCFEREARIGAGVLLRAVEPWKESP